jgi:hypothetical protein
MDSMPKEKESEWTLYVQLQDGDEESTDLLTRQLLGELLELDVESASLKPGIAPIGTKVGDPITIGAIVVAVLPSFLTKLMEFVQAWALRGQGRVVKFKGVLAGQQIEFEGTSEDFKTLVANLSNNVKASSLK